MHIYAWIVTHTCTCIEYSHLIPAPVDRTSASTRLYKHHLVSCQRNKSNTSMTYVTCESRLSSVLKLSMHLCQETRWRPGMRSCIIPGLPTHVVQELNVGTVRPRQFNILSNTSLNDVVSASIFFHYHLKTPIHNSMSTLNLCRGCCEYGDAW